MSNYGILLLSKVIDNNDVSALDRHNVSESHFITDAERRAYRFIKDYAATNRGQAPSYASVTEEAPGFFYTPQVGESYEYLTRRLFNDSAEKEFMQFVMNQKDNAPSEMAQLFERHRDDMPTFIVELTERMEGIKIRTDVREKVGTSVKNDGQSFLDEYLRRKEGTSFKVWKSKFPKINEVVGGYLSGNMYAWGGRSGRGKSVFTMEEIIESAMQGANVLVWAMEMSRFEWFARAYSSISARVSGTVEKVEGVNYEVGFENRALLTGQLSDGYEEGLRLFIEKLASGDIMPGNITLRAADDSDFTKRDVKQLEADMLQTKADVVLIDPIYLMDYEANTSKVSGGDVANTSKKIRRLAGYTNTVIHVVTQAEEVKDDRDDEGNRELRAPKRGEYKKTSSILEDSAYAFGIDSLNGQGIIEQLKGRQGGEGLQVEVLYLPNFGIVKEMSTGADVVSEFNF